MASFAEHLIERNAVTPEQLGRALQAKRLYGGRLGSNLVETGALEAAELTARLSEYLGVPPPPSSWLGERSAQAEKAVPAELVRAYKIVPLRVEKRTLHVAALDPRDPALRAALDEAVDLPVQIWVLPELRLYSLLGKRYGIRRERSVSLAKLAQQARRRREERGSVAVREPDPEEQQRRALGIAPREEGEELVGETFFSDLHAKHRSGNASDETDRDLPPLDDSLFEPLEPLEPPAEGSPAAEAVDPRALSVPAEPAAATTTPGPRPLALESAIAAALDRETLIHAVLELAAVHAEASALLVLDDGSLVGRGARLAGAARDLADVRLPCRGESSLARAMASGEPLRGAPSGPVDEQLLAALGRSTAAELSVLPIRLGDLVVAVICADGPLAETSFAALGALARLASERWERITLGPDR